MTQAVPIWTRAILTLAALAVFGAFVLLYRAAPQLYLQILQGWGVEAFRFPFLDTHAVLSAIECKRLGYDVYVVNPCDILGRPHVYSPLFLNATIFPVTIAWSGAVGIILALGYFAALAGLPPPRARRAWLIVSLATFSPMSLYAVERGNNDLIVFILVTLGGLCLIRPWRRRWFGYALMMVAAALKFYPLALLSVALRERPRSFFAIIGSALVLLATFVALYHVDLLKARSALPHVPYFFDVFGAANLPNGLSILIAPLGDHWPALAKTIVSLPALFYVLLLSDLIWRAVRIGTSPISLAAFGSLPQPEAVFLAIGAVLITGCFFAGQNAGYRGIFFLFLLPGLLALRNGPARMAAFSAGGGAIAILFLMWEGGLRHAFEVAGDSLGLGNSSRPSIEFAVWLVRELIWWRVVGTLAGLLLCFVATSEIGQSSMRWLAERSRFAR
jgi:hypothetical protein